MKKKDAKPGNNKPTSKTLAPLKDLIPASIKQPPRDPKPVPKQNLTIDPALRDTFKSNVFRPFELPEEWPGNEKAQNFEFGVESNLLYVDKQKFQLPPSFTLASS